MGSLVLDKLVNVLDAYLFSFAVSVQTNAVVPLAFAHGGYILKKWTSMIK